jgi:hypothetical protein
MLEKRLQTEADQGTGASVEALRKFPSLRKASKGFQKPLVFRKRQSVPEDVQVTVIGAHLKERVILTVPLIEEFLNQTLAVTEVKAYGSFFALITRIALHTRNFNWFHYPQSVGHRIANDRCGRRIRTITRIARRPLDVHPRPCALESGGKECDRTPA